MSKIVTPRLPEATEEYSREQVSQLIQTLDQVIFVLNNTYICLLYTSPSPRDRTTSRMPSSA